MNRRQLLIRIVQGFSATGFAFLLYPFVRAWIPSFDEDRSLEVSIDDLAPGESKVVNWLGRRVFVQRRTREMVEWFDAGDAELKDPASLDSRQPGFAENVFRSRRPDVFVAFNNCTHLGCEVAKAAAAEPGVGFECPCHQSLYDYAGRVFEGAAAPLNLEVPDYAFVSRSTLRLEAEVNETPA